MANIWSQSVCCNLCLRADVFVYSMSLQSASSLAVNNLMTQRQTPNSKLAQESWQLRKTLLHLTQASDHPWTGKQTQSRKEQKCPKKKWKKTTPVTSWPSRKTPGEPSWGWYSLVVSQACWAPAFWMRMWCEDKSCLLWKAPENLDPRSLRLLS